MPLSEEVSRTHCEDEVFDVPWRSKACREKSAEGIVSKTRVVYREGLNCELFESLAIVVEGQLVLGSLIVEGNKHRRDRRLTFLLFNKNWRWRIKIQFVRAGSPMIVLSPGQAKRHPGSCVCDTMTPYKGKVTIINTFALTGRDCSNTC